MPDDARTFLECSSLPETHAPRWAAGTTPQPSGVSGPGRIKLLAGVKDEVLRAHFQAALIVKYSAAKLPELGGVLELVEVLPVSSVSGALLQKQMGR